MMRGMAKKKGPEPSPYRNFAAIGGNVVHLRLRGQDESIPPEHMDAELQSGLSGEEGEQTGTFYVQSTGKYVVASELVFTAWNRY